MIEKVEPSLPTIIDRLIHAGGRMKELSDEIGFKMNILGGNSPCAEEVVSKEEHPTCAIDALIKAVESVEEGNRNLARNLERLKAII